MRAKEFITEIENTKDQKQVLMAQFKHVTDILTRECGPYIDAVGGLDQALFYNPVFRGIDAKDRLKYFTAAGVLQSMVVRLDRKPSDTPPETQTMIDDWFEKATGIRFRSSSAFAAGSPTTAAGYGVAYVALPAGEFHYCWSRKYRDMYEEFRGYINATYPDHGMTGMNTKTLIRSQLNTPDKVAAFLEDGDYQFDRGLRDAIISRNEIMFQCSMIMLIDSNWLNQIKYLAMAPMPVSPETVPGKEENPL